MSGHLWHLAEHGWWAVHPSPEAIARAKAFIEAEHERARAAGLPDKYASGTDWTGRLGEEGFMAWAGHLGFGHLVRAAGGFDEPDFYLRSRRIEFKTRTSARATLPHYDVQVTKPPTNRPTWYGHANYEREPNRLVILGFITGAAWERTARPPEGADSERLKQPCRMILASSLMAANAWGRDMRLHAETPLGLAA